MIPSLAAPAGFDASADGLMAFAHHLANSVRPLARRHFRTPIAVEAKADASPVTEADRGIEARLRAEIRHAYPAHGILGEEEGGDFSHDLTWVVDPIDGTQSFITGMPLFGTLIALVRGGRPLLGLIDMPALAERWHGNGSSAWFGGKPIRTSRRALAEARLFATSPDLFRGADAEAFAALSAAVGLRRFGGDCYAYGLLASGHCDLVVEAGLKVYDVMALGPRGGGRRRRDDRLGRTPAHPGFRRPRHRRRQPGAARGGVAPPDGVCLRRTIPNRRRSQALPPCGSGSRAPLRRPGMPRGCPRTSPARPRQPRPPSLAGDKVRRTAAKGRDPTPP